MMKIQNALFAFHNPSTEEFHFRLTKDLETTSDIYFHSPERIKHSNIAALAQNSGFGRF